MMLSMEVFSSMTKKFICVILLMMCISPTSSSSTTCDRELFQTFIHDLNSQCPFSIPFPSSPIQVDGESFEKAMSSTGKNEYNAVLFYASWCPFSSIFQSKFSILSSMFPQMNHFMVEQSPAMSSVFSRYGIHSVPSLMIVNRTTRIRYHGGKDLQSLISFYRRTTGLAPVVNMVEETPSTSDLKLFQLYNGASLKETFSREPYLVLSLVFVLLRTVMYFYPGVASRLTAMWVTYIPHLNLGIFGESKQLLGHVLHVIDVKRIWSKLKMCKIRNLHREARNAQVWASSLASVSLGEASSPRVLTSRDL